MDDLLVTAVELADGEDFEPGDPVLIETPVGMISATWLGTVSNGRDLARAMQLMAEMEDEDGRLV